MKTGFFALALLLLSVSMLAHAQDLHCELQVTPILNHTAYACDNTAQQPIWAVVVFDKELFIVVDQPNKTQVAAHIPVVFRSQSYKFYNAANPGQALEVWLTEDGNGPSIMLLGTQAKKHEN